MDAFKAEAKRDDDRDFAALYAAAETAAREAAAKHDATLPPENARGLDCGFAWVVVKPATSKFIRWCRAQNKTQGANGREYGSRRDYGGGGWEFWCTRYHQTQSITTHQAAARAFADTLIAAGIVGVSTGSRLD